MLDLVTHQINFLYCLHSLPLLHHYLHTFTQVPHLSTMTIDFCLVVCFSFGIISSAAAAVVVVVTVAAVASTTWVNSCPWLAH